MLCDVVVLLLIGEILTISVSFSVKVGFVVGRPGIAYVVSIEQSYPKNPTSQLHTPLEQYPRRLQSCGHGFSELQNWVISFGQLTSPLRLLLGRAVYKSIYYEFEVHVTY